MPGKDFLSSEKKVDPESHPKTADALGKRDSKQHPVAFCKPFPVLCFRQLLLFIKGRRPYLQLFSFSSQIKQHIRKSNDSTATAPLSLLLLVCLRRLCKKSLVSAKGLYSVFFPQDLYVIILQPYLYFQALFSFLSFL